MANFRQRLAAHNIIGLDTSVFIYHIETNPRYLPLTRSILNAVQSGNCKGITSTVTVMELTVRPWRMNRGDVAREYEVLLLNFPNLYVRDVSREVARQAAQLRAGYNLRPADALQVATALVGGATMWVTNDKGLKRISSVLEVMVLDEILDFGDW